MPKHGTLNYVEFAACDLEKTQQFFSTVFAWQFESYGPDYCAFANQGLDGGFYRANKTSLAEQGSALLVFYSDDLKASQKAIEQAGGKINKAIFAFPGGYRFHFLEPSGNEFAVWSQSL